MLLHLDKAFFQSMGDSFVRSITRRGCKPISRITVYARKDKILPFPWWKLSNIIHLPPGCRLIILKNFTIVRTQFWSLLLEYWEFSCSCRQISLGEWKPMFPSPCITCITATMATLFRSPLCSERVAEERSCPLFTEWVFLSPWLLKWSSDEVTFWWMFMWDTNIYTLLPIWRCLSAYLFSK